jgi:hypothetical protein
VTLTDCGVRLKLPPKYGKEEGGPMTDDWVEHTYRRAFFDSIEIGFQRDINSTLATRKSIPGDDFEGYGDCIEDIAERAAIIQSYRGGGSVGNNDHQFRTYTAEAVWELNSGEFVHVRANVVSRAAQEEVLAAIRTVEFVKRLPPKEPSRPRGFFAVAQILGVFALPLSGYLIVLIGGGYLVFRRKARASGITGRRRRASLAVYFALVFTPSVLTDLFLFAIPAPALLGFLAFVPALFFIEQWWSRVYAVCLLYLLPMLISFGVIYVVLTLYVWLRARRAGSEPANVQDRAQQ